MSDADPKVIAEINRLAESRLRLKVARDAENQRFQTQLADLTSEHEAKLQEFAERERELDPAIWQAIDANRSTLIARGKRSFVTLLASFQLKEIPAKTEVLDKLAIMEAARHLGVVRQIANPPRGEWRFSRTKFLGWLADHGELREYFEPYLEYSDKTESLTIKPNTNYTVDHDSQRISPPSLSIKKS